MKNKPVIPVIKLHNVDQKEIDQSQNLTKNRMKYTKPFDLFQFNSKKKKLSESSLDNLSKMSAEK